jgi:glycosyltransferase involved in cell wall biosynthesis
MIDREIVGEARPDILLSLANPNCPPRSRTAGREQRGARVRVSDRVRCLIVAPAPLTEPWVGGISNFIRSFVRHMPDDFDVAICGVALDSGPGDRDGAGWRKIDVLGRSVPFLPVAHVSPSGQPGRTPVKWRAFLGLLKERGHIVTRGRILQVHAPAMDLPFIGRPGPTIRVVHNAPENLSDPDSGTVWRHFGWALRRAENMTFRRSDRVFFVDRPTYERYVARGNGSSAVMSYLPNGVDTDLFRPRPADERARLRADLSARFGLYAGGPWLLFAGRLDQQKDPALLISAFAAVRARDGLANAQLLIAGDGPMRGEVEQAAYDMGVVGGTHFLGAITQHRLAELMPAADVFVLPSAYEGMPFVVLEALASGLPVTSTRVGDVPRLIDHQSTGWLAETRTSSDLATGVDWALSQARDEISARCAAAVTKYRIENVLEPFYEAHREVLRDRRA